MRIVRLPRKCLNRINPCNICTCRQFRARGECVGSLKIINRLGRVHNNLEPTDRVITAGDTWMRPNQANLYPSLPDTHIIIPWELISGWWLLALGISVCAVWGYIGNIRLDIFSTQASFHTWWPIYVPVLWHSYLIRLTRKCGILFYANYHFIFLFMFYVGTNSDRDTPTLTILFFLPVPTPHISLMCTR